MGLVNIIVLAFCQRFFSSRMGDSIKTNKIKLTFGMKEYALGSLQVSGDMVMLPLLLLMLQKSVRTSVRPQKVSSILMKFGV